MKMRTRKNLHTFHAVELLPEVTNILVTRDNTLYRKRIYLQNNENPISMHNAKVFNDSPITYKGGA